MTLFFISILVFSIIFSNTTFAKPRGGFHSGSFKSSFSRPKTSSIKSKIFKSGNFKNSFSKKFSKPVGNFKSGKFKASTSNESMKHSYNNKNYSYGKKTKFSFIPVPVFRNRHYHSMGNLWLGFGLLRGLIKFIALIILIFIAVRIIKRFF
ncbi:hypothetical protein ACER0A_008815 [Haloimpatiens sp. FM7315]|uniref:hypothetical protein n=1 Tax=Haloimpatiens sp. FM7315 TaxID=3298609 RepID=UPI0039775C3D